MPHANCTAPVHLLQISCHPHRNDPNGPVYYKGIYHIFYQFNPTAAVWGNMHWGHAISSDGMITWQDMPVALYPDQVYDVNGVFSGSITLMSSAHGEDVPVITYTCVDASNAQMQCIALPADASDATLRDWVKPSVNPILSVGPLGTPPTFFRDPSTAWQIAQGSDWFTAIGAVPAGVPSTVVYSAPTGDFVSRDWKYNGTLFTFPLAAQWADMYECPDFFPLGSAAGGIRCPSAQGWDEQVWAAKISALPGRRDYITLGCFNPVALKWSQRGNITLYDGGVWYASKTFDAQGQRVLWGWVTETDSQSEWVKRGWAGVQSLPLLLGVHDALGVVSAAPLPALDALTQRTHQATAPAGSNSTICTSCHRQFRVRARMLPGSPPPSAPSVEAAVRSADQSGSRLCLGVWGALGCSNGPTVAVTTLPSVPAEKGVKISRGGFIDIDLPSTQAADCASACAVQYGASCVAWSMSGHTCSLFSFVGGTEACSDCTSGVIGGAIIVTSPSTAGQELLSAPGAVGALVHASTVGHGGSVDVDVWYDRSIVQVFAAQGTARLTSRWYSTGNATVVLSGAGADGLVTLFSVRSIWS